MAALGMISEQTLTLCVYAFNLHHHKASVYGTVFSMVHAVCRPGSCNCPRVVSGWDTSQSNSWVKYMAGTQWSGG